jgi:hypothetical protein
MLISLSAANTLPAHENAIANAVSFNRALRLTLASFKFGKIALISSP